MPSESYTIEAILRVRDQGYSRGFSQAAEEVDRFDRSVSQSDRGAKSFKETMLGMASAIGVTKAIGAAWGMVKNSIGSAMDRIDTMSNFSRSIRLMTGDTELANAALDDLRNASRGTAYGLDVMAKATQGLVTSSYDVKTATTYVEGWGNAVAMYGDGSNATLANVTFQLNQMAAKGKANLGDLKSAMEAGIPVLQIYAEETGRSVEGVSQSISDGEISAKDFMATMQKAFSQGTESFPVLTGAAKSAGSTWSATFSNMKAATTRGMVSIIESIESARKDANLPGMKDGISAFGKTMESVLQGVGKIVGFVAKHFETLGSIVTTAFIAFAGYKAAEAATRAIKTFSDGLQRTNKMVTEWIGAQGTQITMSKTYAAAIQSTTGAEQIRAAAQRLNIALKQDDLTQTAAGIALTEKQKIALLAETGALTLKGILLSGLTLKQKLVAAAQLIWNKAIAANPIGAIIVAVTLLVAGLKLLVGWLTRTSDEHKAAQEAAQEQADAARGVIDSQKALTDSYEGNINAIEASSRQGMQYVDTLDSINNTSMDAAERSEKLEAAVDALNKLYPDLNVELNENKTATIASTDAIREQIKAADDLGRKKALQDYLSELYKQQVDLEGQLKKTGDLINLMREAGQDTKPTIWGEKQTDEYKALISVYNDTLTALQALGVEIPEVQEKIGALNVAQLEAEAAAEAQMRSLDNLREKYRVTTDNIVIYAEHVGRPLEEVGEKIVELSDKFGYSSDVILSAVEKSGMSLEDWGKTYEDKLKQASDAITRHADIITNGFEVLEQKSTISLDEFNANMRANQEAVDMWASNTETLMIAGVSQGIIKELARLGPAGAAQAARFVEELEWLNDGALGKFDELTPAAQEKITDLQTTMESGMTSAADAGRVSLMAEDYTGWGKYIPSEMARGLIQGENMVYSGTKKMSALASAGLSDLTTNMINNGWAAGIGLRDGLAATEGYVMYTASRIANSASRTIRQALVIRSPSRKTRGYGQQTGKGFGLGMLDSIRYIMRSAGLLAEAAMPDIDRQIAKAGMGVGSKIDAPGRVAQPGVLNLALGKRSFRAFVADITDVQSQEVELVEVFG